MKALFILLALMVTTGSFAAEIAAGNEPMDSSICSDTSISFDDTSSSSSNSGTGATGDGRL